MFAIDPQHTHVAAKREQVVAIIESVNQPHVAIPGKAPQGVTAWVCGVRNANATFSIYIYLSLVQTKEPVVYAYDQPQFPLEGYRDAEAEALQFVESMGFMMENLNFRNQPAPVQDEILQRVPAFAPPRAKSMTPPAPDAEGKAEGGDLARLLAAF